MFEVTHINTSIEPLRLILELYAERAARTSSRAVTPPCWTHHRCQPVPRS